MHYLGCWSGLNLVTSLCALAAKCLVATRTSFQRRQWHPTLVLLPGKSHGQRSLVGCSPWGRKESDTTEWLHFQFSLSCIGEGNGNPFQCSCLENPRDGEPGWAAVYGVAQSRTRLKWLSTYLNKLVSFLRGGIYRKLIILKKSVNLRIHKNFSSKTPFR